MELGDHADTGPALPIDGDERLDTELISVSDPENAGVDRAGRHRARCQRVGDRRLHRGLDQRDQMINDIRQPEIDDRRL